MRIMPYLQGVDGLSDEMRREARKARKASWELGQWCWRWRPGIPVPVAQVHLDSWGDETRLRYQFTN